MRKVLVSVSLGIWHLFTIYFINLSCAEKIDSKIFANVFFDAFLTLLQWQINIDMFYYLKYTVL